MGAGMMSSGGIALEVVEPAGKAVVVAAASVESALVRTIAANSTRVTAVT